MLSNNRNPLLLAILFGITLPVLGSAISILYIPEWRWPNIPFHAVVEGAGGCLALVMASFWWLSGKGNHIRAPLSWLASGLITMGLLDVFHAVVAPGQSFVWLHSTAHFFGGMFFMAVMVAHRLPEIKVGNHYLWGVLFATVAFGGVFLWEPSLVPAMVASGKFTWLAKGLNVLGGLGFFAATWFFIQRYKATKEAEDYLLSAHCALLGSAGVLFEVSTLWDAA